MFTTTTANRTSVLSARFAVFIISAFSALPAQAALYLQNGSFESIGSATASFSINNPTALPSWTVIPVSTNSLDCLVKAGDTTNLCGTVAFGGGLTFWVSPGSSPDGGNYIAIDGDSAYSSALKQTMAGLTTGQQYTVSFWQAAVQQSGFNGATTEQWQVSFGGSTKTSTLMNNLSHGAVGWNKQSLNFIAGSATDVLSFVALGTPNGVPPFVLLDGVSVTATPEPSTNLLIGLGLIALPMLTKMLRKA